jgi:hypothetical protein
MTDIEYTAIDLDRLDAMRAAGTDEYANPWQAMPAQGWEPLRCCLQRATEGEPIALITYSPWTRPHPWLEAGPVFVHFGHCKGYETPSEYPMAFRDSPSMLNPFHHDGSRAYQHITFVTPEQDHEAAVRAVLANDEVSHLHVRSSTAGCFTFAVQRG